MNTYLDALLVSEMSAHGVLHLLACLLQLPLQPLDFLPSSSCCLARCLPLSLHIVYSSNIHQEGVANVISWHSVFGNSM